MSRPQAPTVYETLTVMHCGECGIYFAAPEQWRKERERRRDTWYCPNGHARCYLAQSYEQKLASLQEDVRAARADAEVERNRTRAYKGHVTRLKNRVGKGRCPACSEEFPNLAEHMHDAHPGFGDDE